VTLDLILIPRLGATGGAITSATAYLITTLVLVAIARSQFRAQPRADGPPQARREIRADSWIRRAVDVLVSGVALAVSLPVILLLAAAVRLTSRGPAFYRQVRVGRSHEPFTIFKLRSMTNGADRASALVTSHADARVTRLGAVLRATKLDELPQLFNVLKGDMTLIGPRPEVPRYIPSYFADELQTLRVRPGLAGAGSIYYTRLQHAPATSDAEPEQHYVTHELHAKLELDLDYLRRRSLAYDLRIMLHAALLMTGLGKSIPAPALARNLPTITLAPPRNLPTFVPAFVPSPPLRSRPDDPTMPLPMLRE